MRINVLSKSISSNRRWDEGRPVGAAGKNRSGWVFGSFVLVFSVFFAKTLPGIGQYWDWSFPYFSDHTRNFFVDNGSAWTAAGQGSPLGYASDFVVRLAFSLLGFIKPELVLFVLFVLLCSIGAMGMYKLVRVYTRPSLAYILALAAFINPAMFYKFTAGHIDYFISYVLFIYFVQFMLRHFEKDVRSVVVAGLFLGLIGIQIQFFVIAGLFLLVYFIFNREKIPWKLLPVMLGLPILLNMWWLSNFLFGGANVAEISANAAKVSFKATNSTDLLSIFSFAFSKATLIGRFYNLLELFAYLSLFILLSVTLARRRQKQTGEVLLFVFLLLMIFMATGLFQLLPLGPLTTFYPMLREVGHFAGPIVFALLLLLAMLIRKERIAWAAFAVLILAVLVSTSKFQNFHQPVNFAAMRQAFAEFKQHDQSQSRDYHRVLAYPFFDQYAIKQASIAFQDGLPLKNSGHESFAAFANQSFIKSAVKPQDFKTSLQYRLLQTYDVEVLRSHNVRYIYDFSEIYESYYERYVPKNVYNNDLGLIKGDKDFASKLLRKNPGKLRRVSQHIFEITDYMPRVSAAASMYKTDKTDNIIPNMQFIKGTQKTPFLYTTESVSNATPLKRLFEAGDNTFLSSEAKTFFQTISTPEKMTLYASASRQAIWYRLSGNELTVLTKPAGALTINGKRPAEENADETVLQKFSLLPRHNKYYIGVESKLREVKGSDRPVKVADISTGDVVQLFESSDRNSISNPSFERESWQPAVGDCNDKDDSPNIDMRVVEGKATEGRKSVELGATHHDACISTEVPVEAGSQYLLSFDYQSDNASVANFYLGFDGKDNEPAKGFRAITNNKWNSTQQLFTAPPDATKGRLFIYAIEGNFPGQKIVNRYDNFSLQKLQTAGEINVPQSLERYEKVELPRQPQQKLAFSDPSYSYENQISNGSFEQGQWQKKPADCNNYDSDPQLSMKLDTQHKTHGAQSLSLGATRHSACTYTTTNVEEGGNYMLSFDYQGNGANQFGYHLSFDDPQSSETTDTQPIADGNWHSFAKTIHVPAHAGAATLHLYAFEGNGRTENVVRYDNVRLVQLPELADRYFTLGQPAQELQMPRKVEFTAGPSRRDVRITGATTPFYLLLSENFHPRWQLALPNGTIVGQGQHFKFNDYGNGWYIDVPEVCRSGGCQRQSDGSYDMHLRAYFTPQTPFMVSQIVTITSFAAVGGYVFVTWWRRKNKKWRHQ